MNNSESKPAQADAAKRPELTFDGCGINGPDEHRTRLCTFPRELWDSAAVVKYGPLFAAAPELLAIAVLVCSPYLDQAGLETVLKPMARAAIARAEGRAE